MWIRKDILGCTAVPLETHYTAAALSVLTEKTICRIKNTTSDAHLPTYQSLNTGRCSQLGNQLVKMQSPLLQLQNCIAKPKTIEPDVHGVISHAKYFFEP